MSDDCYEVIYNTCYGGYNMPDDFIKKVFKAYPPDSEVGRDDLWQPERTANFITSDEVPDKEWRSYYEIVRSEPFFNDYKEVFCNKYQKKNGSFTKLPLSRLTDGYVTKDNKTFYYIPTSRWSWRTSTHVIALAKEFGIFNDTVDGKKSALALAKIKTGYDHNIEECDGLESVTEIFPYKKVIQELLEAKKTHSDDKLGPIAKKLISGELDANSI